MLPAAVLPGPCLLPCARVLVVLAVLTLPRGAADTVPLPLDLQKSTQHVGVRPGLSPTWFFSFRLDRLTDTA